ncbi:MAG TPA: GNAT family N-acetyltransferase [Thermoanaerobaculia bacterium]|nr:GNAT family N-acetyltransferase [Thermoanaerobaculia bacterium]
MRGLRLFIRPLDSADQQPVTDFLQAQNASAALPACGLLGKLLGDIVAVMAIEILPDGVRIDDLIVRADLRRKWIGRAMLRELESFARKLDRSRLVVHDARGAEEFFRRVGFVEEGTGWARYL